jgi:hypothetical protein
VPFTTRAKLLPYVKANSLEIRATDMTGPSDKKRRTCLSPTSATFGSPPQTSAVSMEEKSIIQKSDSPPP